MIGVISKAHQAAVVEEFFELFKTPWEFYCSGRAYDVVVASAEEIPEVDARLLVLYGSAAKSIDGRIGIDVGGQQQSAILSDGSVSLPIYGELLTFANNNTGISCVTAGCHIAGVKVEECDSTVIRLGYDLFEQVQVLLSIGQPVEHAHIPTLDIHIRMLRDWILSEGIPLLEIPRPRPVTVLLFA